jgi:hypothetical protein
MTLEQQEAVAAELDKAAYHIERNANAKDPFSCPLHPYSLHRKA